MSDTFIDKCIAGEATLDQVDQYANKWAQSGLSCSLYEYLGMTKDEYDRWLQHDLSLDDIVRNRKGT